MSPAGSKRSKFTAPVKLVTWKVNSLKVRLTRVLEFLAEHAPDVVCMQETKTEDAAFPTATSTTPRRSPDPPT
jgi:exonuclease III